ncbi:MAG: hypothetical protein ACXVKA_16080 [Acidimicrobiia bacterium]
MSLRARLTHRDERGVALVLALAFIVLIAVVTSALLSSLASAVNEGATLANVRDRQYAADAAVEHAIARVRGLADPGLVPCGGPDRNFQLAGSAFSIRVDCLSIPTMTFTGFVQRNVVFTSCLDSNNPCDATNTIVRAQVNYEATNASPTVVTKTYIQSWTVTR